MGNWLSLLVACAVALSMFCGSKAFGRAGGGEHFSGGSHSGGSSYSGSHSGGGGDDSYGFGYGDSRHDSSLGTLLATVVVIALIAAVRYYWTEAQSRQIRRGNLALQAGQAERLVNEVRAADPSFDAGRMCARTETAFFKIQSAWSGHDLKPVRSFVSDGVYERFGLQIQEQQDLGLFDKMDQLRLEQVSLAQFHRGDVFDAITLRMDASAVDYKASLTTGQWVSGSTAATPWTEYWTFLRRAGVGSVRDGGLIEGRCPNCGGDVSINQNAACGYCGALLRSGEFDWVLCEITQQSEWRPRTKQAVPGFDDLHASDRGLSTDALEDRASVIFWRKAAADRAGQPAVLRKVALDRFVDERTAAGTGRQSAGQRTWFGQIGVGAVDTLGFVADEDAVRAVVRVTWTGSRFARQGDGPPRRLGESSVIRESLVLLRRRGVKSDPGRAIASAHCPSCGRPASDGLSAACESCGMVLNDGSTGWVLETVEHADGPWTKRARQTDTIALADLPQDEPAPQPAAAGLLAWAIHMSLADGVIDPREQQRIDRFARLSRVRAEEVARLIDAARSGHLDTPVPTGAQDKAAWLTAMVQVALADGRIGNRELAFLKNTSDRCGMADADLRLCIKREQARLYAAGRSGRAGSSPRVASASDSE